MTYGARFYVRTRRVGQERTEWVGSGTRKTCEALIQHVPEGETAEIIRRRDEAVVMRAWRDQYGYQWVAF